MPVLTMIGAYANFHLAAHHQSQPPLYETCWLGPIQVEQHGRDSKFQQWADNVWMKRAHPLLWLLVREVAINTLPLCSNIKNHCSQSSTNSRLFCNLNALIMEQQAHTDFWKFSLVSWHYLIFVCCGMSPQSIRRASARLWRCSILVEMETQFLLQRLNRRGQKC